MMKSILSLVSCLALAVCASAFDGPTPTALDEVNASRAKRGLPPFVKDDTLTLAAERCAKERASRLIPGHLPEGDFAYLPPGRVASAAGCAAWTPDWGWGSCCTYDHYSHAGAAAVVGKDGRRYMHLFVGQPQQPPKAAPTKPEAKPAPKSDAKPEAKPEAKKPDRKGLFARLRERFKGPGPGN